MKEVKIKSITKISNNSKRYDLTIKDNHNFYVNNILVHNCMNLKSHISRLCDGNTELGVTLKTDGSSITIYFKKDADGWKHGICSRSMEKKSEQFYISEYKDAVGKSFHKYLHPVLNKMGWLCDETNNFFTQEEIDKIESFVPIKTEVKDSWVELANKYHVVERGMKYCQDNDTQLVFRGEIYGQGLKGSGNKYNPDSNKKQGIMLFGLDTIDEGYSKRLNYANKHNLKSVCDELDLPYTKAKTFKPKSYQEFCEFCESIIAEEKAQGRIIEGVVVRTMYSNDLSTKYMNSEYDSKK